MSEHESLENIAADPLLSSLEARVAEIRGKREASKHTKGRPDDLKPKNKGWLTDSHNANVAMRSAKDLFDLPGAGSKKRKRRVSAEPLTSAQIAHAREILERKEKLYRKLKKGKEAGLTGVQLDNILVDFEKPNSSDSSAVEGSDDSDDSSSDDGGDQDESALPAAQDWEDCVDEFGRTLPPEQAKAAWKNKASSSRYTPTDGEFVMPERHGPKIESGTNVLYGDARQFPVYYNDEEAARHRAKIESTSATKHFSKSYEARHLGTGFYNFSQDEAKRQEEMAELKKRTKETDDIRTQKQIDKKDSVAELFRKQKEAKRLQAESNKNSHA